MTLPNSITVKTKWGEEITLYQASNDLWCCPACGSPELMQQPYYEFGSPSFEICDCFFQTGYDDDPNASADAVEGIRNNWNRWRRLLVREYRDQVGKLEELKAQLFQIGAHVPEVDETGENEDQPEQVAHDHYHDPLLTRLYDLQNPWAADCDFYLTLAQEHKTPISVLDLGCGTGILTTVFAETGHKVTGVDPAIEMLNIALRRPSGDSVMWVKASAESFKSEERFDLIILSGHAFQVFLTGETIQAALKTMRDHLAPGVRLAFEIRNPDNKSWENWTPDKTRKTFTLPPSIKYSQAEKIEVWHDTGSLTDRGQGKVLQYFTLYRKSRPIASKLAPISNSTTIKTSASIRFLSKEELLDHLEQAGLVVQELFGDWDRSAFTTNSPEIIVIAGVKK